jgi:hypothetical protein
MASIIAFFNKIKNGLIIVLSFISAIFIGLFVFEKKEVEVQQALKLNAKTDSEVATINTQITNVEQKTKEEENDPLSEKDALAFLNSDSKK